MSRKRRRDAHYISTDICKMSGGSKNTYSNFALFRWRFSSCWTATIAAKMCKLCEQYSLKYASSMHSWVAQTQLITYICISTISSAYHFTSIAITGITINKVTPSARNMIPYREDCVTYEFDFQSKSESLPKFKRL